MDGKDFVWFVAAKLHVDLVFMLGASLDSPLLRSMGNAESRLTVRYVKVRNVEALQDEVARLLKDAARVSSERYMSKV